jgi:hypothetical protein
VEYYVSIYLVLFRRLRSSVNYALTVLLLVATDPCSS